MPPRTCVRGKDDGAGVDGAGSVGEQVVGHAVPCRLHDLLKGGGPRAVEAARGEVEVDGKEGRGGADVVARLELAEADGEGEVGAEDGHSLLEVEDGAGAHLLRLRRLALAVQKGLALLPDRCVHGEAGEAGNVEEERLRRLLAGGEGVQVGGEGRGKVLRTEGGHGLAQRPEEGLRVKLTRELPYELAVAFNTVENVGFCSDL